MSDDVQQIDALLIYETLVQSLSKENSLHCLFDFLTKQEKERIVAQLEHTIVDELKSIPNGKLRLETIKNEIEQLRPRFWQLMDIDGFSYYAYDTEENVKLLVMPTNQHPNIYVNYKPAQLENVKKELVRTQKHH